MYKPTPHTIEAYTEGDCWHLALHLRKLTGLPLAFSFETPTFWGHVGLYIPKANLVLDIEGLTPLKNWQDNWNADMLIHPIIEDEEEIKNQLDFLQQPGLDNRQYKTKTGRVARKLVETYITK
jgi:hypothetical protein